MVLMRVDLPNPVWPIFSFSLSFETAYFCSNPTNADDIELKAAFQQLPLYLVRDAVEANMALGHHRIVLRRHDIGRCHAGY